MNALLPNPEKIRFHVDPVMRYETLGDYSGDDICVYAQLDQIEQYAVLVHELVEKVLLNIQGVSDEQVTQWDTQETNGGYDAEMYAKDPRYHDAHAFAEKVERKIIETAGKKWKDYSDKCDGMDITWIRSDKRQGGQTE